ncbi:MAG: T9SS type A sorting domain-containing protein [Chitinophagales bacterium]|nr:T9SS type A sorting domain-containing protein [Chitinophagales bacterium]
MKKLNLVLFSILFIALLGFLASRPMNNFEYMAGYKKSKKLPLETRIEGRAEERANQLRNVITGQVEIQDWYNALAEIEKLSGNRLPARGEELEWEEQGPNQQSGRTRGFIFDKTKEGRVYCGGVSGGMFVSEDLGHNWKPVKNMTDIFKVMPIGCMTQSKDGDIYVGTGEYWGNTPNAAFGSQFNGHGIYKKKADEEEFTHLTSTINGSLTNPLPSQFRRVLDIACHPLDNNIVFAATDQGMQVSKDGGTTWTKSTAVPSSAVIAQVEFSHDATVIYAAWNGRVHKSTNGGVSFTDLIGNNRPEWTAEGNQHVRIAVSATNPEKIYACGITGTRGGDLKYVILSEDGGASWELIGRSDASLSPLCSSMGCQGFYDLCLAVHPRDDRKIFLGGSIRSYSWSRSTGWVQATNWTSPASLGSNLVHADKHEFAFHPTRPDTFVVCTDGGPYITFNSFSSFPTPSWKPITTGLNITQFYDMAVNKYGELVGGTQDNGTQFITLTNNNNIGLQILGGDGFDCAISAANNYQTAYTSLYFGSVFRTTDLTSANKSLAAGCVSERGAFSRVAFHTRLGLVERIKEQPGLFDEVDKSFLFIFNSSGEYTISSNAHIPTQPTAFTNWENAGLGIIYGIHSTKDIGTVYLYGAGGVRKNTTLKDLDSFGIDLSVRNQPCLKRPNLAWTTLSGITGPVGGLYVHQTNGNYVVATQIGFGGTNKVFLSTNGSSFVGKQGNLPVMPVYTCAIDPEDEKHVVVGTEFGIWETEDISAASPVWREANKNIGRVPVFKLRVNHLNDENCTVLYAGSHGRGFWRVPFPKKGSSICTYEKKVRSGIDYINNVNIKFDIYPNPTTDKINISFESKMGANYTIAIYDIAGRVVKRMAYRAISGDNMINTDVSNLNNGKYIVRVEDGNNIVGGKIIVKH